MFSCAHVLAPHVAIGDLHIARMAALKHCNTMAATPWAPATTVFDKSCAQECKSAWNETVGKLLQQKNALNLIFSAHTTLSHMVPHMPLPSRKPLPTQDWEADCSYLTNPPSEQSGLRGADGTAMCAIQSGSRAALDLPLLREPLVVLGLQNGGFVVITQDGFMNPFDVATVLWPAGFLLSLWAAEYAQQLLSPSACDASIEQPKPRSYAVLELGAGTAGASLSFLAALRRVANATDRSYVVTATDAADRALALATANAAFNRLPLKTHALDYDDAESVSAFAALSGPFDMVLGAALQFERWQHSHLWRTLRLLTRRPPFDSREGQTANEELTAALGPSIVALAHTAGALETPPLESGFVEVERISGLRYGMRTRWREDMSDFEIVLLERRH